MFACNGVILEGRQKILVNKFDEGKSFYEMWNVELLLRLKAKKMNKVFFLILFACCRDSYVVKQITGEQGQDLDD
jgi:hypothetical protein